jgi:hypothetical protein
MNTGSIPRPPELVTAARMVQRGKRDPVFAKFAARAEGMVMATRILGAG